MKLIRFLEDHPNDWNDRLGDKRVKVSFGEGKYNGLALFKYDILADFTDPIVKECRGVILDITDFDNIRVVCRPFDKFCNYGERGADKIDWSTAKVQDKIDGSIMKLFYWNGEWCKATNGTIDAYTAKVGNSGQNFGVLFDKAFEEGHPRYAALDIRYTYIFELTSPYNRVVVDYGQGLDLWHLGTRNNVTGEEVYQFINIKQPNEYDFTTLDECIEAARNLNISGELIQKEGFVVVDGDYHRIKIKSPEYVMIHHIIPNGEVSDEKLIELIRNGEISELLVYVPSLETRVNKITYRISRMYKKLDDYYSMCRNEIAEMNSTYPDIEKSYIRKDFAIKHQHDPFFPIAMKYLFDHKESNLDDLSNKKFLKLLDRTVKEY